MKLLSLSLFALPLITAAQPPNIATFEEHYINALPVASASPNASALTLVGYKSIAIAPEHVADFERDYYQNTALWGGNRVYDAEKRAVRVYFPVAEALVARGDGEAITEADSYGRIDDDSDDDVPLHVLGRRQTEFVSGVEGNVIRDGIIYLSEPAAPVRRFGRALVYDFGAKELHSHGEEGHPHHSKRAEKKKSCLANHNGKNCSKTYGINQGRCKMNTKTCMDYNGIVTDCKNHSSGWKRYRNFVGSDCDVSMGRGHCWNEVM